MSKDRCGRERPRKARSYTARDVGRIAAAAREDGANDADMIAYLLEAFGVGRFGCAAYKFMQFSQNVVLITAIIGILQGTLTLYAGWKKLRMGTPVRFTRNIIDLLIPKRYKDSYAAILAYIGATEIALNALVAILTLLSNAQPLFYLIEDICIKERKALGLARDPNTLGPLETIELIMDIWRVTVDTMVEEAGHISTQEFKGDKSDESNRKETQA